MAAPLRALAMACFAKSCSGSALQDVRLSGRTTQPEELYFELRPFGQRHAASMDWDAAPRPTLPPVPRAGGGGANVQPLPWDRGGLQDEEAFSRDYPLDGNGTPEEDPADHGHGQPDRRGEAT